jgi:hypothetical protein
MGNFSKTNTKIKNSLFRKADIIIYVALTIVVSLLLVFFVFLPMNKHTSGFIVSVEGKTCLTYRFQGDILSIEGEFTSKVDVKEVDGGYQITVYHSQDKSSYNQIYIDVNNKTAKVTESSCSVSKDCVHTPSISNSGVIYCAPHALKILPIESDGFIPPSVG